MREAAERLFDAVTCVREDLVEEAQTYVFRRRVRWQRYLGIAACLVLAVSLGLAGLLSMGGSKGGSSASGSGSLNSAPQYSEGASSETAEPAPSSPPPSTEAAGSVRFTAVVREVHDAWLLVEALPEETTVSPKDSIEVPLEEVADLPALSPGDQVSVTCTDVIHESAGLVRAEGVREIALAG